ncbi:nucleophile aminohydrolase [Vibrio phage 2.275.O._10N.286.54.E11]|nr:nucleophile aminohydrolase [Vibrio phage 2.275.O._10N.286.54.E11]
MCGIFASKSKEKFIELMELNAYRGTFSHSIACVDLTTSSIVDLIKNVGPLDVNSIPNIPNVYYIGHVQAPTTQDGMCDANIHPAVENNTYMWHNGIIKEKCISELQKETGIDSNWDTLLLLSYINNNHSLSEVDGTFACVVIDKSIKIFRNAISPMFIDDELNLSSVRFKNAKPLTPNVIHNIIDNTIVETDNHFVTKNNPYNL